MMTKVLAVEWARDGVRVNAIAPGCVETEMVRGLAERGILDQARRAQRTPIGWLVDGGWSAYGCL